MLVWDFVEFFSTWLNNQAQSISKLVVSAIIAVRWLEANAGKNEQELAIPTPEQLNKVSLSRNLDLFKTSCKLLRILKAIERKWTGQRLIPLFLAVMTTWMLVREQRHMSQTQKTEM